jgi:IS30 family transposase
VAPSRLEDGRRERTNGLLRQYLPRGTDPSHYTQVQLDAIALELTTRPRKMLGKAPPAVVREGVLR